MFYILRVLLLIFLYKVNGIFIDFGQFDLLICSSVESCIHEQAHKMDKELNYISGAKEFRDIIDNEYCELTYPCYTGADCYYSEVYALFYQVARGDINRIPENLQEFYKE